MGKAFFEVFPTLKLNKSIHDIMKQTRVEKISATKRKDFLRVYLYSTRLILKEDIWEVERQIKEQLFPSANLTVKIYERFELSSQYTPEKLMDIYRESILAELKDYSHIEYTAFKTADITYPKPDKVLITMGDTVLNRSKEEELVRIMEKILVERCGLKAGIQIEYREAETGKYEEEDALKIRMKVDAIYTRIKGGSDFEGQQEQIQGAEPAMPVEESKQGNAAEKTSDDKKNEAGDIVSQSYDVADQVSYSSMNP